MSRRLLTTLAAAQCAAALSLAIAGSAAAAGVTFDAGPPPATNATTATFAFHTSSSELPFQCRVDDAPYAACSSPYTADDLGEGDHTFAVRTAGAVGEPALREWKVDLTPPPTVLDAAPPAATASTDAAINFSSPDPTASFECSLNGGNWNACASPRTFHNLSDGERNLRVRARDAAGNADTSPLSVDWRVDATAPQTTIVSGPLPLSPDRNPDFAFAAGEDATFMCSRDGGPYQPCPAQHELLYQVDGPHTLRVRATDTVGNVDPTPAQHSWTVDSTGPQNVSLRFVTDPSRGPGFVQSPRSILPGQRPAIRISGGADATWFQIWRAINPGNWSPYSVVGQTASHDFRGVVAKPGERHCWTVVAYDALGNKSNAEVEPVCGRAAMLPDALRNEGFQKRAENLSYFNHYYAGTKGDRLVANLNGGDGFDAPPQLSEKGWMPREIAVLATKCPTCGKLRIAVVPRVSSKLVYMERIVDLRTTRGTERSVLTHLPTNVSRGTYARRYLVIEALEGTPRVEGVGIVR